MSITPNTLQALAYYLQGVDGEVPEVTLSVNGATGLVDARVTVAVDEDGSLEFETRYVEL